MPVIWPSKDPDEVLDFTVDWSARLDGDTISTSAWTVPLGITAGVDTKTASTTTLWLSGGTLGSTYDIVNRIVTAGGRTMDQNLRLTIAEH